MILNIENLVEVLPFEDDYAIFIVKDGSFGVLNCDGEVTITPLYAQLSWLGPDRLLAFSSAASKYVEVIDSHGNVILPKIFNMVYDYFDGRYIVEMPAEDGSPGQTQWGVITETGKEVIYFESGYQSIRRIGKYYLAQQTPESRYVLHDYEGEYVGEGDRFSVGGESDYIAEYDYGLWEIYRHYMIDLL